MLWVCVSERLRLNHVDQKFNPVLNDQFFFAGKMVGLPQSRMVVGSIPGPFCVPMKNRISNFLPYSNKMHVR